MRSWFGNKVVVVDVDAQQVVDTRIDRSGLMYFRDTIQHRSITGTLLFQYSGAEPLFMQGWYVQNPYASHPIEPSIWPVDSRYVVLERDEDGFPFRMGWRGDDDSQSHHVET